MKTIEIKGIARENFGTKESKTFRRNGQVPCVIYGGGENVHFAIEAGDLRKLIYTDSSYIINFDIDGKQEVAVMREVQFHPVKEEVLHIDFFRVIPGKPVTIDIPVVLTGNSEGVKQGGKLMLSKRKLRVTGQIENLTDTLTVDITKLQLGKSIFVSDVNFEGLEINTPATTAICAVKMTRAARGAAAAAAAKK
ncbi:MAG: 50S ribosomal protein L25/general stress protein Ctc [Rikenellaceae bacterium]